LRAWAFARGALVGPDDQGLIAYLAIREVGLALLLPERPIMVPRDREV